MESRDDKRHQAAELVANTKHTVPAIAELVGCSPRTINTWKSDPEFRALVSTIRNAWRDKANAHGIADVDFIYRNLQDRHKRLRALIEYRANDKQLRKAPGGRTGMLTVTYKMRSLGADMGQKAVPEYSVDTGLLEAISAIEVQMQTHMGNWKRRIEYVNPTPPAPPPQVAISVTFVNVPEPQPAAELDGTDQRTISGEVVVPIPTPPL